MAAASKRTPMESKNPLTIMWKANVTDFVANSKDITLHIPCSDQGWEMLNSESGADQRNVLISITHAAQAKVLGCGIPWQCLRCKQRATKSVNTPALHNKVDPPVVIDYCFIPVCGKVECESFAHRRTQEIIEEGFAPAMKTDGYNLMEASNQYCAKCKVDEQQKKLSRCSRCRAVFYCCRECQVADWSRHKEYCLQVPKDLHKE